MSIDGFTPSGPTALGQALVSDEDRGIIALVVRKDSGAAVQDDGEYGPLQTDSSGNLRVNIAVGSSIVSGTKTVTTAGTAVRITATATPIKGVWVCADLLAAKIVTVGDSSVVGNASGMRGIVLTPGNPPVFLNINDLSLLYVDAQANGGKLSYLYQT